MSVPRLENEDYIYSRSQTLRFLVHELLKYGSILQPYTAFQLAKKKLYPNIKYPEIAKFDPQADRKAAEVLVTLRRRNEIPYILVLGHFHLGRDYTNIQVAMQKVDLQRKRQSYFLSVKIPETIDDIYTPGVKIANYASVRTFAELLSPGHMNTFSYLLTCMARLHSYMRQEFHISKEDYEQEQND